MNTLIDYHPVTENEQEQAIALWYKVCIDVTPGFFERYYSSAAPSYRVGDTLGAWCDGQLISAVHICRLTFHDGDETYLCGGIANVATLSEYREKGISRQLLHQIIDRMKNEGFQFSTLSSARNSHYSYVGYEECSLDRQIFIDLNKTIDNTSISYDWTPTNIDEEIINIYAKQPRPIQLDRSRSYFEEWVNWNWQNDKSIIHVVPKEGYIVLHKEDNNDFHSVSEWRAVNREIEEQLLLRASSKAQQDGSKQILLSASPIFVDQSWIENNVGSIIRIEDNHKSMIRNIGLTLDQFDKMKSLYSTGKATMWPGDFF